MLLHTEHSLLSLLEGMKGVIAKHDFYTELCLHEELNAQGQLVYNGVRTRRIVLVLDCLYPNDFTDEMDDLINLQVKSKLSYSYTFLHFFAALLQSFFFSAKIITTRAHPPDSFASQTIFVTWLFTAKWH